MLSQLIGGAYLKIKDAPTNKQRNIPVGVSAYELIDVRKKSLSDRREANNDRARRIIDGKYCEALRARLKSSVKARKFCERCPRLITNREAEDARN